MLPTNSRDKAENLHVALLKLIEANFVSRSVVGQTERFSFVHTSVQEVSKTLITFFKNYLKCYILLRIILCLYHACIVAQPRLLLLFVLVVVDGLQDDAYRPEGEPARDLRPVVREAPQGQRKLPQRYDVPLDEIRQHLQEGERDKITCRT